MHRLTTTKTNIGKILILLLLSATFVGASLFPSRNKVQYKNLTSTEEIQDTILAQIISFSAFIKDTFQTYIANNGANQAKLKRIFLKSRMFYKKFEWAVDYFTGSRLINGPPVYEVENADLLNPDLVRTLPPAGLQVIGEQLFPRYDTVHKKALIKQLYILQEDCEVYKAYFTNHTIPDWQILDAARLEVFRILTLGITGYDDPLTLNCMSESATSLRSLKAVLAHYANQEQEPRLIQQINAAIEYLQHHTDFDTFNRAVFILNYGNKISTDITNLSLQLKGPHIEYNRLLRQDAKTLFDSNAFNIDAFAPGQEYFMTRKRAELGKRLFFDASLSGTGTRSCASCHQPDKAYTDGLVKNISLQDGKTPLCRNTPTILNSALQSNLFFDMRALTLEDQARDAIEDKTEMGGSLQKIVEHLRQSNTYRQLFSAAYPQKTELVIDTFEVMNAIASYVRSLTKLNSRFDEYMRGNKTALTKQEIKGFNLFMGKAQCATCHFMPLFNGVPPPKFIASEVEVIGVPSDTTDTIIDPDLGWYNIIGVSYYKHAFKTPTLRNAGKTAPYMHNGVFTNLKEVMDFYNNGGGTGSGVKILNQTLSEDSLHLTSKEINEVIAFIKSLNSR